MKIFKRTIFSMVSVCIFSFCLSIIIELKIFDLQFLFGSNHIEFYKNIFMGVFTSGLLVLIPSIVSYLHEKKKYYIQIYQTCGNLLISALEILTFMEQNSQEKMKLNKYIDNISIKYNELVSYYSNFTYFIFFTKKDKLIESIVVEVSKYSLFLDLLFSKSQEFSEGKISEKEYIIWFENLRKEMVDTYRVEFTNYREMIDTEIKVMIKDRKLKKYY